MLKQRTSEQIRGAAITMGIKKAQSGCTTCAEGYFDLAKQHGAAEEEIQAALEQATGASGKGLSRRDLIKIAVASGLALTSSGLLLPQTSRVARAATYYWGIDSNTTICCAMPLNFYIGRMGQGITADTTYFAFNTAMANQLGPNFVFGYWGVQGPVGRPSQYDPYGWGVAQGQAAWDAWSGNFIGAASIGGYTVFGDIEEGFGGWLGGSTGDNQQTLNGFLNQLWDITPAGVWPGLYVSQYTWNTFFGSGFVPSIDFVFWLAGTSCSVCAPCASCTTTIQDVENQFSSLQNLVVGGQKPILWQYWLTPGCNNPGCNDWDVALQLNYSLTPSNS